MATVAKSTRHTTITLASASAGPFDLDFRLFDDEGLKVYVNTVEVTTFSISSTFLNGFDDAATITFDAPLQAGDVVDVLSDLEPDREADLIDGIGLTSTLNIELARIWSALSDMKRDTLRSVRMFSEISPIALAAGTTLMVGASGIEAGPNAQDITSAQGFSTSAASSAQAAAASAAAIEASAITPEAFGAVGDGAIDDTQAWLDLIASGNNIRCTRGKEYRITAPLDFGDDALVFMNGSRINYDRTDASNTSQLLFGTNCILFDLNVHMPGTQRVDRCVQIDADSRVYGWTVTAANQMSAGTDQLDGHIRITGSNVHLYNGMSDKIDRVVNITADCVECLIDGYQGHSFVKGINLYGGNHRTKVRFVHGFSWSANAGGQPGENLVGGGAASGTGSDDVEIVNATGKASEHLVYIAGPDNDNRAGKVTYRDCICDETEKSMFKVKFYDKVIIQNCGGQDAANTNTKGPNENVFTLWGISTLIVTGSYSHSGASQVAGYHSFDLDGVTNALIDGAILEGSADAQVLIRDTWGTPSLTLLHGMTLYNAGSNRFLDIQVDGDIGDVLARDITYLGSSVEPVSVDVGGSVTGTIYIDGYFDTNAEDMINNVAGGDDVVLNVGRGATRPTVMASTAEIENKRNTLLSDVGDSQRGNLLLSLRSGGTQGANELGPSLAFSGINTGRRRAAIASFQDDITNPARIGLSFMTSPSTTASTDAVVEQLRLTADGDLIPVVDNSRELGSATMRFAKAHVTLVEYGDGVVDAAGNGTPEGTLAAAVGSTYRRKDGGAGTSHYVKETGDATSSGWVAK